MAILPRVPTFAALLDMTRLDVAILVAAYPLFVLCARLPGGDVLGFAATAGLAALLVASVAASGRPQPAGCAG